MFNLLQGIFLNLIIVCPAVFAGTSYKHEQYIIVTPENSCITYKGNQGTCREKSACPYETALIDSLKCDENYVCCSDQEEKPYHIYGSECVALNGKNRICRSKESCINYYENLTHTLFGTPIRHNHFENVTILKEDLCYYDKNTYKNIELICCPEEKEIKANIEQLIGNSCLSPQGKDGICKPVRECYYGYDQFQESFSKNPQPYHDKFNKYLESSWCSNREFIGRGITCCPRDLEMNLYNPEGTKCVFVKPHIQNGVCRKRSDCQPISNKFSNNFICGVFIDENLYCCPEETS